MPAATVKPLFLQIGGSSAELTRAAKAASATLVQLGEASGDLQDTLAENFRKLGGNELQASARSMEAAFRRTFANIRASAEETLGKPVTAATVINTNVRGAEQALATASAQAAAYRDLADAQTRLVSASPAASDAERQLAVTLTASAIASEENVVALRQQLATLMLLRTEAGVAADAETELAASHNRMGAAGMIAEHVVRSVSDSVAAGISPVRALTMEMGRITEGLTLWAQQSGQTEGAMGKFAGFMGGPWGLAISVGVASLLPLVTHLLEGGDATDQMHGKVLSLVDALSAEAAGTDAARKALEDYNAEKKKGRDEAAADTQKTLDQAKADLQSAMAIRQQALALADKNYTQFNADPNGGVQGQIGAARGYQTTADRQATNITDLREGIRNIEIEQGKDAAKAATDPIEAIRQKYKALAASAEALAAKNDKAASAIGKTLTAYAQQEKAEIDAAQARQRLAREAVSDNRQSGRQIDLGQAESIVHGIGGTITSETRTPAQQQVLYDRYQRYVSGQGPWAPVAAKPGTSEHERGQALDIAKTAGMTLGKIVEAFRAAGVRLTEKLDEGDHYHVAWGPKGPSADALTRRRQTDITHVANDDRAFQSQLATAQTGYANAQIDLTGDPSQRGQVERANLYADLGQKRKELADQVTAKKLSQAQADQLDQLYSGTEELQEIGSLQKERLAEIDKQLAGEQQQAENAVALLGLQQDLALTTKQRRDLALRQLAAEEARERAPLQAVVDHPELHGGADSPEVKRAQAGLAQIDAEHPYKQKQILNQTANPAETYRDQLQKSVGDVGTDVKTIEVDTVEHLGDALDQAANKALKLHGVLGSIASDILKMLIQREIELPIANILAPPKSAGGDAGGSSGGGLLSGVGGAIKSFFGLFGGGKAVGGGVSSSKFYVVGEHGPEVFAPGQSGTIIPNHALTVPSSMADLSSADMRYLTPPAANVNLRVQTQEGALFRPVVSAISSQHAAVAQQNATNDGAQLAETNRQWAAGRQMGSGS